MHEVFSYLIVYLTSLEINTLALAMLPSEKIKKNQNMISGALYNLYGLIIHMTFYLVTKYIH